MTDQAIYSDDGEYVGEMYPLEDGGHILVDQAGTVLSMVDENFEAVDPTGLEFEYADDEAAQPVTREEFEAWQHILTEQQAQQQAQQQFAAQQPGPPQLDMEQVRQDIQIQTHGLEHRLGRQLTAKEQTTLGKLLANDLDAGRDIDVADTYGRALQDGRVDFIDMDNHADRTTFMTERLVEHEREQRNEDPHEPEPPRQEFYDLSNREERHAWQTDRLEGRLDDDQAHAAAYDGSE